jgi:tRNA pseudouridine32 synthase/23S rRNA pseudouridine746 synthase
VLNLIGAEGVAEFDDRNRVLEAGGLDAVAKPAAARAKPNAARTAQEISGRGASILLGPVMSRARALSLFLVAYGNVASLVLGTATPAGGWPGVVLGLLLLTAVLTWRRSGPPLSATELGLTRRGWRRSAALGLLLALGVAVPAVLFLRFPPLVGQPVEYAPLGSLSREALLWRACVWMPLDTAIPEEVAFRGVLLATLRRRCADVRAALISAAVFTAWHGVIVSRTVALTNLQAEPLLATLGLLGAFLAVSVGGLLFAWLRLSTGHLAGSVVAHWAFNAVLLLGLAGVAG